MLECEFTTDDALATKDSLIQALSHESKSVHIDEQELEKVCNAIINNYRFKTFIADDGLLYINLTPNQVGLIREKSIPKFTHSYYKKNKKYNFEDVSGVISALANKGSITNLDRLQSVLRNKPFKIILNCEEDNNVLNDISNLYKHHYWHLSKVSSLQVYYDVCVWLRESQAHLRPLNVNTFNALVEFLHNSISEMFYLVGEVDFEHANSKALPVFIQADKFSDENITDYYERFMQYINDSKWALTNSCTELLDMYKYIHGYRYKDNDYTSLFELEMFRNPYYGISDYRYKKYEDTQVMLIKLLDKVYPVEYVNDKLSNLKVAYKEVRDFE